jgi:hypothetical protein
MPRRGLLGPLGIRLALACLGVAVGALGMLSGLVLVAAERDVSHLVRQHQDDTVADVAHAARAAHLLPEEFERPDPGLPGGVSSA